MLPEDPDIVCANDGPRFWARWPFLARATRWAAGRRGLGVAGAVVVIGAVAGIVVAATGSHPPARPAAAITNARLSPVHRGEFAAGMAEGQPWQFAVLNVAADRRSCLPAVQVLVYADILYPGSDLKLTPAGALSVLTGPPEAAGTSFAFFRIPESVRQLRVTIGTAPPLILTPASESQCGQAFRLAGFAFASRARVTVTAVTRAGKTAGYRLPDALVHPPRYAANPGGWQNLDATPGWGNPGLVSQDHVDGTSWGITVASGGYGDCFSLTPGARRELSDPFCAPVGTGYPQLEVLSTPALNGEGYALQVGSDVVLVAADLTDGKVALIHPVEIGGLLYAGLITTAPPVTIICYANTGYPIVILHPPG